MKREIKRMWINQPSTLQPLHKLHGKNVLAEQIRDGIHRIYFLEGDVISSDALSTCLSKGWLSKINNKEETNEVV